MTRVCHPEQSEGSTLKHVKHPPPCPPPIASLEGVVMENCCLTSLALLEVIDNCKSQKSL